MTQDSSLRPFTLSIRSAEQLRRIRLLAGRALPSEQEIIHEALAFYLSHLESSLLDRAKGAFDEKAAVPCPPEFLAEFFQE